MSRLARDRTAKPVLRDQILGVERGQGNVLNFLVPLTTSRIGNLTRLIQLLAHTILPQETAFEHHLLVVVVVVVVVFTLKTF